MLKKHKETLNNFLLQGKVDKAYLSVNTKLIKNHILSNFMLRSIDIKTINIGI